MIDPILLLISYISCSCACRPYTDSSAHYTTKPARAKSIGFFANSAALRHTTDGYYSPPSEANGLAGNPSRL
jgi:hypothetical protein